MKTLTSLLEEDSNFQISVFHGISQEDSNKISNFSEVKFLLLVAQNTLRRNAAG